MESTLVWIIAWEHGWAKKPYNCAFHPRQRAASLQSDHVCCPDHPLRAVGHETGVNSS